MTVNGKMVESEGQVWSCSVEAYQCEFELLNKPSGDSTYQLEGRVNVCETGWQEKVWPNGK